MRRMARPKKSGVDYFSHDTSSGKTMFTLESQYGNDGYAFWFKLLELLGTQEGLFYNCNEPANWLYLLAKTRVTEEKGESILNTLAQLDAIDAELWKKKIIWSQNFADRLSDVYKKRGTETPCKPSFCDGNLIIEHDTATESTQSKVNKTKGIKEKEIRVDDKGGKPPEPPADTPTRDPVPFKKIQELFLEICPSYPAIRAINGQRQKAVAARWNEHKDIRVFEELFRKAEASSFMKGHNDRNWTADFDWMMKPTNFSKILEGRYEDKGGGARNGINSKHSESEAKTNSRTEEAPTLTGFRMATDPALGKEISIEKEKTEAQANGLTGFKMAALGEYEVER